MDPNWSNQEVDVRYSSNVLKEKLIVEKLMQGPSEEGAYPTINPAANLLSVTTKGWNLLCEF